ncbi:hypothetical protein B9Z19DRAFT_404363 [Tuber borchii]|uniref:Uncharacterized protein n=1 Tax=Tuber borchii TaxID=42251 RepID=A0A2T6ZH34_TUBBO|nr:hypothetical protein B9Z19DRAFT_404363 [Tuber borchii]
MFRLPISTKFIPKPPNAYYRYLWVSPAAAKKNSPLRSIQQPVGHGQRTLYPKPSHGQAEERLNFVSVRQMLATAGQEAKIQGLTGEEVQEAKGKVYERIVEFLEGEGYPTKTNKNYREVRVDDLVFTVLIPVISMFRRKTRRNLRLRREKSIIAIDGEPGRNQEFVMIDIVGVDNRKFVFFVESKKSSLRLGEARKQRLLAMKEMGEMNGGGVVYGFVTTGEEWQMLRFEGTLFTQTDNFVALFPEMAKDKQRWMEEGSIIVDCIHATLRSGGFVVE